MIFGFKLYMNLNKAFKKLQSLEQEATTEDSITKVKGKKIK